MKILITGINGFLGCYAAKYLKAQGHIILGIGSASKSIVSIDSYYSARLGNTEDFIRLRESIDDFEVIIHLAANLSMDFMNSKIIQDNVIGMQQILLLADRASCKKIIYMSSIMVYGFPRQVPITEEHSINCSTLYHCTKFWGEQLLSIYKTRYPKKCCVVFRLTSPIGYNMRSQAFLSFILNKVKKREKIILYGQGKRVQNYIDIRDICRGIQSAVQKNISGTFNFGGGESYSNEEVVYLCKKICRSDSLVCFAGQDEQEDERWILDSSKIQAILGFIPRYSLENTIFWMLRENRKCE